MKKTKQNKNSEFHICLTPCDESAFVTVTCISAQTDNAKQKRHFRLFVRGQAHNWMSSVNMILSRVIQPGAYLLAFWIVIYFHSVRCPDINTLHPQNTKKKNIKRTFVFKCFTTALNDLSPITWQANP
ncbi:hypothetical protein E3U43_016510 [Larimichthys crocea]|uniref:Uncharacterized protein n=1 Tax=Larimichthys crocea TaxID=215358 RepID=A0ACD3QJ61_LARCR|nr:hypothetical protein E3U43_016510 [Larimichthys crocea]